MALIYVPRHSQKVCEGQEQTRLERKFSYANNSRICVEDVTLKEWKLNNVAALQKDTESKWENLAEFFRQSCLHVSSEIVDHWHRDITIAGDRQSRNLTQYLRNNLFPTNSATVSFDSLCLLHDHSTQMVATVRRTFWGHDSKPTRLSRSKEAYNIVLACRKCRKAEMA